MLPCVDRRLSASAASASRGQMAASSSAWKTRACMHAGVNLEPAILGHSLHRLAERRPGHAQPVCQVAFGWQKGAEGKTGVEDRLDEAGFGHFAWLEWGLRVHGIPGGKRSYHSTRVHPVVDDTSKERAPFLVSPERRVWSLQRPGNCGGGWPTWLLGWPYPLGDQRP